MVLRIEVKKGDPKTLVLYWDEEVWRSVYKPLFISELRKLSADLTREEFLEQFTAIERKIAKRYVIWLLSRRIYLSSDLTAKLVSKGFSPAISQEIVAFCQSKGYLDDSQEISRLIAREQKKGLAARAIYYKLKAKRGIDETLVRQLLEKTTASDQGSLKQWLEKHAKKINRNDPKERNKLIAKLCRRGFSAELVIKELNFLL